jgi:hypothetical protein
MRPLSAPLRVVVVGVLLALALPAVPAVAAEPPGRILFFENANTDVSLPQEDAPGNFAMTGGGRLLQSFGEKVGIDPVLGDWNFEGSLLTLVQGNPPALLVEREDGRGRRKLAGGTRAVQALPSPEFSFAGDRIAYSAQDEDTSEVALLVIPAAGGAPRVLTHGLISPGWSPDARRIVAAGNGPTPSGPGAEGLWVVDVATGATSLLVGQSGVVQDDVQPEWSPDGALIAFTRGGAVWTVGANGFGARAITGALGARQVAWSPDGSTIAFRTFASERSGAIYTVGRDGRALRVLYRGNQPTLEDWVRGALSALKPTRRAVVAQLVKGVVKVKPPGNRYFARLVRRARTRVPYRSEVNAKRGRVQITARRRGRRTVTAALSEGQFKLFRRGSRTLIKVSSGKVRVRRSGRRKAVTVPKGDSYVLGRTR